MATMKHVLNYGVRWTRAAGAAEDSIVPVITDRAQATDLETLIENCIDRNLIAGLKPTAAQGIADGIAEQLAYELKLGRGIQFGQYFYGRPYLSGTTDANGTLSKALNGVNVRLYKGNLFKLSLADFSMHFDGSADAPKIDFIVCDGSGVRGEVHLGASVKVNGRFLYAAGDTDKVYFLADGETEPVVVDTFTAVSDELLSFAYPAGLVSGKVYKVWVERKDANGIVRRTDAKPVTVKGSAPVGPAPDITRGYSEGEDHPDGCVFPNTAFNLVGTNLNGARVAIGWVDGDTMTYHEVPAEKLTVTDTVVTIAADCTELADGCNVGGVLTFKVTTTGGADTYEAEVME